MVQRKQSGERVLRFTAEEVQRAVCWLQARRYQGAGQNLRAAIESTVRSVKHPFAERGRGEHRSTNEQAREMCPYAPSPPHSQPRLRKMITRTMRAIRTAVPPKAKIGYDVKAISISHSKFRFHILIQTTSGFSQIAVNEVRWPALLSTIGPEWMVRL